MSREEKIKRIVECIHRIHELNDVLIDVIYGLLFQ